MFCSRGKAAYHLPRSSMTPGLLEQIFQLQSGTVSLFDADNMLCIWNGMSFFDRRQGKPPFTAMGCAEVSFEPTSPPHSYASLREMQKALAVARKTGLRPPTPLSYAVAPGSVPGTSPFSAVPPPGVRKRRSTGPVEVAPAPLAKVLKVYSTTRDAASGKPKRTTCELVHVDLTEENCSVPHINAELRAKVTDKTVVLCDIGGVPIPDDDTTRTAKFWGFGRGTAGNARKYFALPPVEIESDDEDDSADDSTMATATQSNPKKDVSMGKRVTTTHMSDDCVRAELRRVQTTCGITRALITHSFREGVATTATERGVPARAVMAVVDGRPESFDQYKIYTKSVARLTPLPTTYSKTFDLSKAFDKVDFPVSAKVRLLTNTAEKALEVEEVVE
uniref:Uncharacterized protein n=1 Tax=Plectus sambesii TaxID=2011161 RepID=A0A914V1Q1_9BILA